jgi:catechol 2,3-dioxygenase-like lactoylglutathione lyase family enzyme
MNKITIHWTFLPHNDADASLAFYRDTLGFEVRNDVGRGGMRWITVGPAGPARHLHRPGTAGRRPGHHRRRAPHHHRDDGQGHLRPPRAGTPDVDGTFAKVQASGAEVVQEPTDQPYGVRDCAFRDPAGNLSASTNSPS